MKRAVLCLFASLCLLLSGCRGRLLFEDYREIDQLDLVETLGLDRNGEEVTVIASTGSSGGQELLKNTARTISRGVREMQSFTERKYIFYGHTAHLLVGEAEAREGLRHAMEFVERDSDVRLDTWLYVVQNGTAEEVIASCSGGDTSVGERLSSLQKDVELMSESYVFTCGEVAEALEARSCGLVAAIRLEPAEHLLNGEGAPELLSSGYALLKEGRLVGYLNTEEARGANLLMDRSGSDVLEAPDPAGGWFAARLTGSRATFHPSFEGKRLRGLEIRLTVHCNVDELVNSRNSVREEELQAMERTLAELEAARVRAVLYRSQLLKADFCGIGDRVRRAAPLRFDGMEEAWASVFPNLEIRLYTEVRLERSYDASLRRENNT